MAENKPDNSQLTSGELEDVAKLCSTPGFIGSETEGFMARQYRDKAVDVQRQQHRNRNRSTYPGSSSQRRIRATDEFFAEARALLLSEPTVQELTEAREQMLDR